jgi:sialate O-acetylesterase
MRTLITSLLVIIVMYKAQADVRLPKVFGDNMVLQRDQPITIWGWASPKEKVTIQFDKQSKTAVANRNGEWKINLDAVSAGGPYQLTVKGKNALTFNNVLVGDVWICSGQSNMEWTVSQSKDAMNEIAAANYPTIRHIKIPNRIATDQQKDIEEGEWKVCSPATAGTFTAVGYYFARQLTKELNVPIGLINSTWGGTHVETWISREGFESSDEFKSMIASMPRLDLDSLAKVKQLQQRRQVEAAQGKVEDPATAIQWKEPTFDDSQWKAMRVPGHWEQQSLPTLDGVVWFRKTITLTADQAAQNANLELAMIDDSDETFVNGRKVGETKNKWNEKRRYSIPPGVLKEGKNLIAVRVEDYGWGGGIHGSNDDVKIQVGGQQIPLAGDWNFRVESILANSGIGPNSYPTLLFNAMINPIIPYSMKGVIWYQGESNADRAKQYEKSFPLMITDWRKHWGQDDFPFYFVQLASYNSNNGTSEKGSAWAELREAQTATLSLPNTGMAVTTDIGDPIDIHPRNKQDVGKRLAAIALLRTYGKNVVDSGPTFKSFDVKENKIVIHFDNIGSGLMVKDKYGYLKGFEIAGSDQKFKYAKAEIQGNDIIVYHDDIRQPVAVRFGWADDASDNNLFNKEGFPAVPFRTDRWKGITEESKFKF